MESKINELETTVTSQGYRMFQSADLQVNS